MAKGMKGKKGGGKRSTMGNRRTKVPTDRYK